MPMTQMLTMTLAILTGGVSEELVGFRESLVVSPTSDAVGGQFGISVDSSGSVVIVGAIDQDPDVYDVAGPGYASVLYLDETDGSLADRVDLQASDGVDQDSFGYRVAIGSIAGVPDPAGVAYVAAPRRGGSGEVEFAGGVYVFRDSAEGIVEQGLILPSEESARRFFGGSIAFDGTHLVVGGHEDSTEVDGGGTPIAKHGSVWVFEIGPDGMPISEHRLVSDVPAASTLFGWSVSVDGDRLAVGAVLDSAAGTQSGAVHIFDKQSDGSWLFDEVIALSDLSYFSWLGTSVRLVGDTLIASAIYATNPSGSNGDPVAYSGAAVVFDDVDGAFTETQRIYPPIDHVNSGWGVGLDFDGSVLVIGANQWDDVGTLNSGAAAIYERGLDGQFSIIRTVLTDGPTQGGSFGVSVALSDSGRLVVGMPDILEQYGGKVCIFDPWCGGDSDGSGGVDVVDLLTLLEHWGDHRILSTDVVQDFEVDMADLLLLIQSFGECQITPPL